MAIERVKIDSTAASPFRVSVSGVAVDGAEFNTLIFDANQSPLRLWATGYGVVGGITWNEREGGQNTREAVVSAGPYSTPPGTTPLFITMLKFGNSLTINRTPFQTAGAGGGCGVCGGVVVGLNFNVGLPSFPDTPGDTNYIAFALFKNYN